MVIWNDELPLSYFSEMKQLNTNAMTKKHLLIKSHKTDFQEILIGGETRLTDPFYNKVYLLPDVLTAAECSVLENAA